MLRSLGLGLGLQTFAKFLRVSISDKLVSEKSLGFSFGKIWSRKKVSVSVSEKFGLGKKSRFWFQKNLVLGKGIGFGKIGMGKKSRFRSKFWYRHSVLPRCFLAKMCPEVHG